ncbi:MAG: hypothetical protein AB1650_09250 [Candidatus Omnitrophota bacterium]
MLLSLTHLKGRQLKTKNGEAGRIRDFHFDDKKWRLMLFVTDSGSRFNAQNVYISFVEFNSKSRWPDNATSINSVKKSRNELLPDTDICSSEIKRAEQFRHYYYLPEWVKAHPDKPSILGLFYESDDPVEKNKEVDQDRFHSLEEMLGYQVRALDGDIGHVSDLIVDDYSWKIFFIVFQINKLLVSNEMLIGTMDVMRVQWPTREVFIGTTKDQAFSYSGLSHSQDRSQ